LGGIWEEEEDEGRHCYGGKTFNQEEDAPVFQSEAMAGSDAVGESAREARGQGSCGEEPPDADAEFAAHVEEAEQVGDSGPVARFEDSEEEAQRHGSGPGFYACHAAGHDTPVAVRGR
jgi:hypothetical protein